MDCESCGRHLPSGAIGHVRSSTGTVVMVCGRCRRHVIGRVSLSPDHQRAPILVRPAVARA